MLVLAWIATALLGLVLLPAGLMKLSQTPESLVNKGLGWVADVPPLLVRTIGALEVLAVVGLVVPPLLDLWSGLAVVAAGGIVLLMIGAAVVHGRRREIPLILVNLLVAALAVLVIIARTA